MPTVVALNPFNLAVTDALVGANLDKFLSNHSNGDSNKIWSFSSFMHYNIDFDRCRTKSLLDSVPPLGKGKKKTDIMFRPRCLFRRVPTKSS